MIAVKMATVMTTEDTISALEYDDNGADDDNDDYNDDDVGDGKR